jgi:hypothetical protein
MGTILEGQWMERMEGEVDRGQQIRSRYYICVCENRIMKPVKLF